MNLPDGWLTQAEAKELQRVARNKTVLELGAWKGRSTVALAQVATYVVSVDRHKGIAEAGGEDSLPDYLANVRNLPNVAIVIAEFEQIVPLFWGFDVVFIDGDHTAEAVTRDIELVRDLVIPVWVFHDWDFPSVRDTTIALIEETPDRVIGSLAVYDT